MSDISYPRPNNVRGRFGNWVTADMFHIAQRLQEVSPDLYVQVLDKPRTVGDQTWNFVIVEWNHNLGCELWVTPVKELDGRVIEHVQYLLKVPFDKRFEEAEKLQAKREKEDMDRQLDEALENWGWDFRKQLAHDGFIAHTSRSFPKARSVKPTTMEPAWRPAT